MASISIRRASSLACIALIAPLAGAQKPAHQKPQSLIPTLSTSVTAPVGGGFLGGSDSCATPVAIGGAMSTTFDLTTATTGTEGQAEGICYFFGTTAIDSDVWWEWTPGFSGVGRVTTCTLTTTDTKIAAYSGSGCPAAAAIACNDDDCGLQSTVDFPVAMATTYTIQLGTFPGASAGTGSVSFENTIPPVVPPNDDCGTPDVLPGEGTFGLDIQAATTGTQGQNEALCYAFGTSAIDQDVWYTYVASCDGTATVTTCGLTTVDTKIAAYDGAGCPTDGTSVACNDDACGLQSTIAFPVTNGSSYTIQIGTFPGTATNTSAGMFDLSVVCSGPTYPPDCFGNVGTCGCGNNGGAGEGCGNSTGAGAVLSGSGAASLTGDTFVLSATGTTPQPGIFFQGDISLTPGAPVFGDGYRCCGQNVVRIGTYSPSGGATDTATGAQIGGIGPPIASHPGNGGLMAGDTRCYQWWYRDSSGPCGSGFNLSNSVSATWTP